MSGLGRDATILEMAQSKIKELCDEKKHQREKDMERARKVWWNAIRNATNVNDEGALIGELDFEVEITNQDREVIGREYATLEAILATAKEDHVDVKDLEAIHERGEKKVRKISFTMNADGKVTIGEWTYRS